MGKKKKAAPAVNHATVNAPVSSKHTLRSNGEDRRAAKLDFRKKEKRKYNNNYSAQDWAAPAPAHLKGRLDIPKPKSKYQSYFEFAENTEKKEKKLEFQVGLLSKFSQVNL